MGIPFYIILNFSKFSKMRSTDEQLLNLSKWKYLLLLIFTASVTFILKENLKLKKNFNEAYDDRDNYSQNTVKIDSKELFPEEPKKEEKLKLKNHEKAKKKNSSPENCDRNVRL